MLENEVCVGWTAPKPLLTVVAVAPWSATPLPNSDPITNIVAVVVTPAVKAAVSSISSSSPISSSSSNSSSSLDSSDSFIF